MSNAIEEYTPLERIKRARTRLLDSNPFFGYLALGLKLRECKKEDFPPGTPGTTAVDFEGKFFYFPEFVKKLTDDQCEFVVAHEIMHLALSHNIRFYGDLNTDSDKWRTWNIAGDIVINDMLKKAGFKVIEGGASSDIGAFGKYKGKSTEEIFEDMLGNTKLTKVMSPCGGMIPQNRNGKENDNGNGDKNKNGKPQSSGVMSKGDIDRQIEQWKKDMINAAAIAKQQGKLPGDFQNLVDALLEPPKVDWREALFRYVQQNIPQDFTWVKPSKKSIATGYYLPAIKKELIKLVIALDVSGSVGDKEYVEFLSEMFHISRAFNHVEFIIISADAAVQHTFESASIDEIIDECQKRKGYGGTSFVPAFKWVEENVPDCKVMVYFTDGYGDYPKDEWDWHTIWVFNNEETGHPPFGQEIRMVLND